MTEEIKTGPRVNVGPEGLFSGQKISSAIEKFVERGDEPEDLILRSDFPDYDIGTAWLRMRRKAQHFKDKELEDMLMNYTAMLPAIGGKRIGILKDAVIGTHSAYDQQNISNKFKRWLGMGQENQNG